MNQPTIDKRPINKVSYSVIGSAGGGFAVAALYRWLTGESMPAEVAGLLAALLAGVIGYVTPLEPRIREALLKRLEGEQ